MKLKGTPCLSSDSVEANYARLLACSVLSAMDANEFELIGSVEMSVGTDSPYRNGKWIDGYYSAMLISLQWIHGFSPAKYDDRVRKRYGAMLPAKIGRSPQQLQFEGMPSQSRSPNFKPYDRFL